ncbi:hypothetical protein [Microbacterium sp. Leaf288]|uniref:hypothetical protein n=1 Tax=Microbacterium sp. Leaf288 TaxID=1736323 RepID=UPI0012F8B623|nr:hypothetical protein [Microbacterium sp. Leaf288]
MRQRRLTWMIGGIGLIVCGVMGMLQYSLFGIAQTTGFVLDVVFAAAVLLFAVGLSREASVVARRPLGVIALAVVALWPLMTRAVQPFLPTMDAATFEAGMAAYREAENVLTAVFFANLLVSLAASLLASVQIARAGVVPRPWNWAPLWALIASAAAGVIPQILFSAAGSAGTQVYAEIAVLLGTVGFLSRTLGLGILALVLATRVRTGSVDIYRSS